VYLRPAQTSDVPAMMALQRRNPAVALWSQSQYEALFVTAARPQGSERFAWVVDDEPGANSILGYLVARRVDAEWELENIVVSKTARRRGVGTRLLDELITHARAGHATCIFLEVRESNQSARALYRKAGFQETGLRKGYYSTPAEDAILCQLSLY